MFDEPETICVRRSDLRTPSPSPPPVQPQLHLDLEFTEVAPAPADDVPSSPGSTVDFPLFSSGGPSRIRLKSPTPPADPMIAWNAAAQKQSRPESYYFAAPLPEEQKAAAVVEGKEVRALAKTPYYGCRLPWRVLHLTLEQEIREPGRKRPGKKRRLQVRKKMREEEAKEEARRKSREGRARLEGLTEEERERLIREEKNRKNREKKRRRREKEREKKRAAGGAAGGEGGDAGDADSDSEEENGARGASEKMEVDA